MDALSRVVQGQAVLAHTAIVAWGSIGLLCSIGVRYTSSMRTGPDSGSPSIVSVGNEGC
jgi:hypothetical protein